MQLRRPALIVLAVALLGRAQSTNSFEVASIKPTHDAAADSNLDSRPGGRLVATNTTVRYLIRLAYDVKDYQIEHAPGWVDHDGFDIAAKMADGKISSLDDERAHIRALLADRFHFSAHRETRQSHVYLLSVGRTGAKLTPHNDGSGTRTRNSCGHLAGSRLTVDVIATILSRQLETDVLNQTGLSGKYDFNLDWTPDAGACAGNADPVRASIFTAVQEQLGLKLESAKGPVEFLVIDKVEHPSEN